MSSDKEEEFIKQQIHSVLKKEVDSVYIAKESVDYFLERLGFEIHKADAEKKLPEFIKLIAL